MSTVKNRLYVGMTDAIDRRVSQHNKGQNRSTAPYRPFKLLFTECYKERAV
ncbi:MAG: GIY-YIG nuclease family protein [Sinomicrobium sp.]|nr:GIY-YIG nuclease family protein [Sinomicrobium sp.]